MTEVILGDPGAVSGGGKKSKRVRKNLGEKKSRRRRRAPGDKVLTDQFQTAGVIVASDWCRLVPENLCIFLPNHRAARLGVISRLLTR